MKKTTLLFVTILLCASSYSQALLEGFESPTTSFGLPLNWARFQSGNGFETWMTDSSGPHNGSISTVVYNETGVTAKYYLATPMVTIPSNGQLRFWVKTSQLGDQGGILRVKVASATLPSNQTSEAAYTSTLQTYTEPQLSTVTPIVYEEKVIDFPAATYPAGTQVYIAFVSEVTQMSDFAFYIDDVLVVSKCLSPTTFTANPILSTSATLSWDNPNIATNGNPCSQWEIEIIPTTGTFTGTGIIVNTNSYVIPINTLTPLTSYKYRVRSKCTFSTSDWSTFSTFTTTVAPLGCNGNYVDSGGTLTGTAGNYQNNENIITTISPTNLGDLVTVTFTSFDTEARYDGMYVYDGPTTASPQILSANPAGSTLGPLTTPGAYWGNTTLPGPFTSTSADGSLTFNFKSDSSFAYAGWVATITCSPRPTCTKPSGLIATSTSTTSVNLTWTQPSNPNNSTATAWQYIYLPCASPAPTAATTGWISSSSNNVNVPNLTPGTCYKFYVRADCTNNDYSAISAPATVSTPLCNSGCNYSFIMKDSFGDGWNGNTMSVIQNGITIATLTGPTDAQNLLPITVSVSLCPGPFQLFWNTGGSYSDEVGISITSFLGTVLYTHAPGTGLQNSLLYSGNVRCVPPTCLQPTNLTTSAITSNSVTLGWTNAGLATSWQVIALPCGSLAPTATTTGWLPATTNSLVISNLISGCYDFYVRGVCSPTDSSDWSSILSIGTLPPSCANTTPAGNTCGIAVPICNFNGYCGNTSSAYTIDTWSQLTSAFSSCSGASIDNNSFISFIASSSTISLNVWVTSSTRRFGIQMMVFSAATCGSGPVTSYACWNPGVYSSAINVVTASGLTTGNTYYLMIDGYAGDVCDYVIGAGSGIQTSQMDVTTTNASICVGQSTVLNATGGNGSFVWSPNTGLSATSGSSVTFTPTVAGSYNFTATSSDGSPICPQPVFDSQIITVSNPSIVPTFSFVSQFCSGTTPPSLPLTSDNGITGTWSPNSINNLTSNTYTFTPNVGQCATTKNIFVEVLSSCTFNAFASAVWIENCATSNFFNTTGSGVDLIGPSGNVFPNTDLGVYTQNSGKLKFKGGEVKTFKSANSNVCGVNLNYKIYLQSATPPSSFTVLPLQFFDNCSSGAFPSGGPCSPRDQKWHTVLLNTQSPIDLTLYPPGIYKMEVYYDISGSNTTTSGPCPDIIYLNNGGANYISTFTIQQTPQFVGSNPTLCNATDGKITISGLASNVSYSISYKDDGTPFGPTPFTSSATGEIIVSGLNAGSYTDFLLEYNSCSFSYTSVVLVNPIISPTFTQATAVCTGTAVTLPTTSINFITGTWSTPTVSPPSTTFLFTPDASQCANTASMTVTVNPNNTIALSSAVGTNSQTKCIDTAITTITYATVGASGAAVTGLPTGVTGSWVSNVFTISGTSSVSGLFNYTVTLTGGCGTVTATGSLTVTPKNTVSISSASGTDSQTKCNGSAITPITYTTVGATGATVTGLPAGVTSSWVSNVVTISGTPSVSGTFNYTVTLTGGCGTVTATGSVTVMPNETPTFAQVPAICFGNALSALPTSSTNTSPISGSWSPFVNNSATTLYTFSPTAGQCATTATMTITVNDLPDFTISYGCDGENYILNAVVTNGANPTYIWYDALHQSIGTSSSITITDDGNYSVAVSINGCSEEKPITISNSSCIIPKGISPNGDGQNDFFDLSYLNIQKLQIFNRYGLEVYSKINYTNEWIGKSNSGEILPDGTYYFIINFSSGKTKTGWVYINK